MTDLFASPGPFTVAELAAVARCSTRTVEKAIKAGAIRACKLGRVYRIPASAARAWAVSVGVEPEVVGDVRDVRVVRDVRNVRLAADGGRGAP